MVVKKQQTLQIKGVLHNLRNEHLHAFLSPPIQLEGKDLELLAS
jgi:hypothetical protein